jgi:hypothetical protein
VIDAAIPRPISMLFLIVASSHICFQAADNPMPRRRQNAATP